MKKRLLPLFLLLVVPCFAQKEDPDEIITDFGIDEFIYVPKSTMTFGVSMMSGPKVSFAGSGTISWLGNAGTDFTTPNLTHAYNNGFVGPDQRTNTVLNADGTVASSTAINGADGKTSYWSYSNANQVTANGDIAMSNYAATIHDSSTPEQKAGMGTGVEVTVTKDFGKLFGTGIRWGFTTGFSINDIHSSVKQKAMVADITTQTDVYGLNGVTPPAAPYSGGQLAVVYPQQVDGNGNPVFAADGVTPIIDYTATPTDPNVPINSTPNPGESTTTVDQNNMTMVNSSFLLKGQYYTMRLGPTFYIPLTENFRISISGGLAVTYAGTDYRIITVFTPDPDTTLTDTSESAESKLLLGYYVNANLEYSLTEKTGLYIGAAYQTAGSYNQSATDPAGITYYTTHIDLKTTQGMRAGMTYKF